MFYTHKVSIIIPVRNQEKFILRCIRSLLTQHYDRKKYEINVIDDSIEDMTMKDDLSFISEKGLSESINLHFKLINIIEKDSLTTSKLTCNPFLQKRDLYPEISTIKNLHSHKKNFLRLLIDVLIYADGKFNLFQIQEKLSISLKKLNHIINILYKNNFLK